MEYIKKCTIENTGIYDEYMIYKNTMNANANLNMNDMPAFQCKYRVAT